ncbi:DMT family transporter [Aquabacterium sp.]|uniref:DMT family transporter n=1 Tax=Aquabacterium sp. TaxID=1872578 RepID=UPI0037847654
MPPSTAARPATHPSAGVLMALLAAMLWGTTGTAQSLAPAGLSAYWVGALRLVVAGLFFLLLLRVQGVTWRASAARLSWPAVLLGGLCMAGYNLAFFAGVKSSGIAVGTAVAIGSGPIWAGLLDTWVSRRAPALPWWCGTVLAVAGGALLVGVAEGGLQVRPQGIVLCLAAGFSYAAYVLVNKRLVNQVAPAVATCAVFGTAALIAAPLALLIAGPLHLGSTGAGGTAVLVYLGVVTTGVAYLLFSHAQRHIAASTAVTLALGEPITAFVLAVVVVGEHPRPSAFAGLLMVLAGLAVVIWTELRAARRVGC